MLEHNIENIQFLKYKDVDRLKIDKQYHEL
jgi:hypothetical protein